MNPIVEKFNKTNPNYNLVVSEYEPEGHYRLRNKQGELCIIQCLDKYLEAKITYYGSRLLFKFHY